MSSKIYILSELRNILGYNFDVKKCALSIYDVFKAFRALYPPQRGRKRKNMDFVRLKPRIVDRDALDGTRGAITPRGDHPWTLPTFFFEVIIFRARVSVRIRKH